MVPTFNFCPGGVSLSDGPVKACGIIPPPREGVKSYALRIASFSTRCFMRLGKEKLQHAFLPIYRTGRLKRVELSLRPERESRVMRLELLLSLLGALCVSVRRNYSTRSCG